jgi:hypothetical protein
MILKTYFLNYSKQVLRLLTLILIPCLLLISCKSYGHNGLFGKKDSIPTQPVWYPIDATKKGSKLEIMVRVDVEDSYGLWLCFYTNRPEYQNRKRRFGEYGPGVISWREGIMSFFPSAPYPPLTKEQREYENRLSEMMFGEKFVDHHFIKANEKIPTPVKIQLFSKEGLKIPIFYFNEKTMQAEQVPDEGIEPQLDGLGESYDKKIGAAILKPGIYKIIIEILKDNPGLKGIRTEFALYTNTRAK